MQALRTAQEQARSQLEQARARAQAADQALTDELRTAGIDCEADVPTLTALRDRLRRDQEQARHAASEARAEAATAHGALTQQARALPSVPEAEEHLAACRQDLTRIRDLDQVLELTQQFLRNAQDAVHRDIAPVLSSSLTAWLPRVTDERYHSAAVDPKDLKVRISAPGAPPRESELLSRGTAEQVYLLLRIALSHHLARADESCPLLLDDVTVQCDEHRTLRLLGLLHELSADQQIVLFAQESFVAEWAQRTLTGPTDKVIHLPRVAAT
jgi:uncharacterized protein YhaN